jgi:8-oxo-dGTP pyrophosphatase MutT (NUDIX family)
VLKKLLQRYWRWTRALTLGARAMVLDSEGRLLLVRHTYTPGWQLPGGGVELGETIETALERELMEEAGIRLQGVPELFGIYSNGKAFPGDHVALFVVRAWHQERPLQATHEIAEARFFRLGELPDSTTAATRRRIDELQGQCSRQPMW